ncbi:predicted protein [Francisella tularensis subsp. novicida GA99-3548]|uniref:DEAD/DEAH box helicase family protein n=1 Tax=Francisella tularensis TaxID=263 RepID=UPI000158B311|nr:DEAD/DEAH box helicase family protein [Francisella tularensis]AJI73406.1 DEAD/DEAH box helicase family protein [Francisella tularensis subsp. novicida D9876]EDN38123.1 predicted protein [Francisella tularensis subsp. novicida GA99-3548]
MAKKNIQQPKNYLQSIVDKSFDENLIADFDYNYFNGDISLFDYQQKAVKNFIFFMKSLFGEKNRSLLLEKYLIETQSEFNLNNLSVKYEDSLFELYSKYFNTESHYEVNQIDYLEFIKNKLSFWMATGSGKTIVMIKTIAILFELMKLKSVPTKPIMILAPTDDILNQIRATVETFNKGNDIKIDLKELKGNWEADNRDFTPEQSNLALWNDYIVYYYKSNNFVATKEEVAKKNDGKNIYYENYLAPSGWYLFLDEAHRGDGDTSVAKAIFDILAKDGCMFNFSATFVDDIDIITTVYNYNLEKFLTDGFGKKLYISDTTVKELGKATTAKNTQEDEYLRGLTITKTLVLLALHRKNASELKQIDSQLYHSPLMMVLAKTVSKDEDGLKPFFAYLVSLIKDGFNENILNEAKSDLCVEICKSDNSNFKFGLFDINSSETIANQIRDIKEQDIWQNVFGGNKSNIEVITYDNNKNELAFQLKTANKPFALLVIGDALDWIKKDKSGVFEFASRDYTKSLFKNINNEDSIAILMGSQMFKEGWDSNRPNIVCYLGVGLNGDNKKYVMQTIGRGIRINPFANYRKRFDYIDASKFKSNIAKIKELSKAIETEFVFASNKKAIDEIWSSIQSQAKETKSTKLNIIKNPNINKLEKNLLIPKYKKSDTYQERPFIVSNDNKMKLNSYVSDCSNKVLALKHNLNVRTLEKLNNIEKNFQTINKSQNIAEISYLIGKIANYFNQKEIILDKLEYVADSVQHYKYISTTLTDNELEQLEKELKDLLSKSDKDQLELDLDKLLDDLQNGLIDKQTYKQKSTELNVALHTIIDYKYLKKVKEISNLFENHYYQPILYTDESLTKKFSHIIKEESEIEFLEELSKYVDNLNSKFKWWYFSRIDETLDKDFGIEYFDVDQAKNRKFYPDFIFWLKDQNDNLKVVFVDPKGIQHQNNPFYKLQGFKKLFVENDNVYLWFYNKNSDIGVLEENNELKSHWVDCVEKIFF